MPAFFICLTLLLGRSSVTVFTLLWRWSRWRVPLLLRSRLKAAAIVPVPIHIRSLLKISVLVIAVEIRPLSEIPVIVVPVIVPVLLWTSVFLPVILLIPVIKIPVRRTIVVLYRWPVYIVIPVTVAIVVPIIAIVSVVEIPVPVTIIVPVVRHSVSLIRPVGLLPVVVSPFRRTYNIWISVWSIVIVRLISCIYTPVNICPVPVNIYVVVPVDFCTVYLRPVNINGVIGNP